MYEEEDEEEEEDDDSVRLSDSKARVLSRTGSQHLAVVDVQSLLSNHMASGGSYVGWTHEWALRSSLSLRSQLRLRMKEVAFVFVSVHTVYIILS